MIATALAAAASAATAALLPSSALALVLGQGDPLKKPWEPGSFYASDAGAADRADLELSFQPLRAIPPYVLRAQPKGYDRNTLPLPLLKGDLLFHAPKLLGPRAGVFGLSCDTCHPAGVSKNDLFVEAESDRPGNVDLLSDYFYPEADDGVFAPRNIPSLRGIAKTAPYRRDGSAATLRGAVAFVIGHEFQQPLRDDQLDALTAYLEQLDFAPHPYVDDAGALTARAPPDARAGEAVFDAKGCRACHLKAQAFTDGRVHDFQHGAGKRRAHEQLDTPSLLGLGETAPYFFDGSAPDLKAAVAQIDRSSALNLNARQQELLRAYLEAIGAVEPPARRWTTDERVAQALAYRRLLEGADDALWTLTVSTIAHQLRQAVKAASVARPNVVSLLRAVEALERRGPTPSARSELLSLSAPGAAGGR
jgi:hypothetical protein